VDRWRPLGQRRPAPIPDLPDPESRDFTWEDGNRLIRFGQMGEQEVLTLLESRGLTPAVLLTGGRNVFPLLAGRFEKCLRVPEGPVPDAAAAVRDDVGDLSLVALGGGRVIDSAKAIAGADRLRCAAIPTTLSGAEMTPFHRMPAGVDEWRLTRPELVVAIPSLMASQPMPALAASAMNALAHAVEALYTQMTNGVATEAALRAAGLIAKGLEPAEPERTELALAALLAGYASGIAGIALHHAVCQTIVRAAGTPHAQTNAVMLPHFVGFMELRAPDAIARLADALGAGKTPQAAAPRVGELAARAGVTCLGELGVERADLDDIVSAALQHPALGNAPDPPGESELRALLEDAL
jgi:maleylacetate reductase